MYNSTVLLPSYFIEYNCTKERYILSCLSSVVRHARNNYRTIAIVGIENNTSCTVLVLVLVYCTLFIRIEATNKISNDEQTNN